MVPKSSRAERLDVTASLTGAAPQPDSDIDPVMINLRLE
jgi:hypothetical protein